MKRAPVIARRELASYFHSPVAYVAMALFLFAAGVAFVVYDFQPGHPDEMRHTFESFVWLLVFVSPVLTMSLLAQEWSSGTMETLMTTPIDEMDVVLGKFLGSMAFFVVLVLPTLLFVAILAIYGHVDLGPVLSGYLGIFLTAALFISVGLFCSSMTKSQLVAAFATAALLFASTIIPYLISYYATISDLERSIVNNCIYARYAGFARGTIDTGNVVFFIAATGVFLFLSVKKLESRRWQ
jgi:ABC-2 type transport system permease protein